MQRKRVIVLNLKEQEYICELARCGSITKAAAQLFITQPALSTFVRNVEKSLGVDLFIRDGKRMMLTYAGELYVNNAEKMLKQRAAFLQEIDDIQRGIKGRFVIGIQRRRCPHLAVQTILRFARQYPGIELMFKDNDHNILQDMFLKGELDLLLHNDIGEMGFAESEILMQEKILLAIPYSDTLVREGKWLPDNRYPWLDLKLLRISPNKITEVSNIETQLQMVAEGLGVSFTRESYAALFQYDKRPNFFSVGEPPASKPLYIIYRKEMKTHPGFDVLVQCIKENIESSLIQRLQ